MKIYVLNPSLAVLGIVSNFISLQHVKQFAGSGSFKLKAPYTAELFDLLAEDNILYWADGQRESAVYIDSIVCETEQKKEIITASGKNLRGLLGRRIVWSNINFSGTVEDFARQIITGNAINPTNTARQIPLLSLEPVRGLAPTITRETENDVVEDLLDDVSAASGVGFDILLDKNARGLVFVSYEGTDRRTTQEVNPWVIVSRDRNNVVTATYTRSGAAFRNAALISGFTDDETGERHEIEINEGDGLSRREIYIRGSATKPKPKQGETQEEVLERYDEELRQKGREKLASQVNINTLEVEPAPRLLEGLDAGDKVTAIEKQYNLTAQPYVSEITTYFERGGRSFDVTLGDAVPTIYKKLAKEIV